MIIVPAYIAYRTAGYAQGTKRISPLEIFLSLAAVFALPLFVTAVCSEFGVGGAWRGPIPLLRESTLGALINLALYVSLANLVSYLPALLISRWWKRGKHRHGPSGG